MSESIETQVRALNAKLREYQAASGKTWEDVLGKQGGKLAFLLSARLRAIAPGKGTIRAERLAALKAGGGIRVREAARAYAFRHTIATSSNLRTRGLSHLREKTRAGRLRRNARTWWQLAVKREIGIRESGRGFLATSARYPRLLIGAGKALSRYGPVLSQAAVIITGPKGKAEILWDPSLGRLAASAAEGLDKPRGRSAIALALQDLLQDIDVYLVRKQEERIAKAGLK